MMHDSVAAFYGGYDQVGLVRARQLRVPWVSLGAGFAALVLVAFVAADVSALSNGAATVQVTNVNWYALGGILVTTGGFSMPAHHSTVLTLTCTDLCFRVSGAVVSPPFTSTAFSVVYEPMQYVNVTVLAPSSSFQGPLSITLVIP